MSCSPENLLRNSCALSSAENGERDALAAVRMMISLLSIMGSSAIVASIIRRRLVWKTMMQPIFQLSIADLLLGLLWVAGAYIWFRGATNRVWCFGVSLTTVVLECVTANLTLVYAILAYSSLKKNYAQSAHEAVYSNSTQICHPVKLILLYVTAWVLPIVIVGVVFASLASSTHLVRDANSCSCWCYPHLGNILPFTLGRDLPSATYTWHIGKLLVAYSTILFINFFAVLVVMSVLYWKILKEMKIIKKRVAELHNDDIINIAMRSRQSKARQRITLFLSVFLAITLSTVILCTIVLYYEGRSLRDGITIDHRPYSNFYIFVHIFQSVTVPLQGFLNAIIYGHTREDLFHMVGTTTRFFTKSEPGGGSEICVSHHNGNEESADEEEMGKRKDLLYSQSLSGISDLSTQIDSEN